MRFDKSYLSWPQAPESLNIEAFNSKSKELGSISFNYLYLAIIAFIIE